MSWELKKWFDNSFRVSLKNKVGAAFVTAQSSLGGTDTAIMEILRHMMVKGMLVCSGMGTTGKGRFQIGAAAIGGNIDKDETELGDFGANVAERILEFCKK